MHKGRIYPFHWYFWTLNHTFWPRYVGNRLGVRVSGDLPDDWHVLDFPNGPYISQIGVPAADRRSISYRYSTPEAEWTAWVVLYNNPGGVSLPGKMELTLAYADGRTGTARGETGFPMTDPTSDLVVESAVGGFTSLRPHVNFTGYWPTWAQGGGDPAP